MEKVTYYERGIFCGGFVSCPQEMEFNISVCAGIKKDTIAKIGDYDDEENWETLKGMDVLLPSGQWIFITERP